MQQYVEGIADLVWLKGQPSDYYFGLHQLHFGQVLIYTTVRWRKVARSINEAVQMIKCLRYYIIFQTLHPEAQASCRSST